MSHRCSAVIHAVPTAACLIFPGIVLDPVYSGKGLYKLLEEMREAPDEWRGRRVMFLHTGGLLGMYDKLSQLEPIIERTARASRLRLDG